MGKRILFVSPTGTLDNGAERAITNFMVYLSQLGHSVFNVYPENGHPTHEAYVDKLQSAGIATFPLATVKWWWEEAPGEHLLSKEERILFYQKNIQDIRNIILEHHIDLVISNTVNVFQGAVAAACETVPHFWLIHELPEGEFSYYAEKLDFLFENSEEVFAVQGNLTDRLKDLSAQNSKLKSFIPFTELCQEPLKEAGPRRIISIGLINDNKNQLELLQAYHKLGRFDLPLIFIGDWDEQTKQECDRFIAENSLTNVSFWGYKAFPWRDMSESDICVFTSKSESFSLVFIEAILKGLPTIVSDNLGYSTVQSIFKAGLSYPLGNAAALAEKISDVLEHFDVYKQQALESSQRAKELYRIDHSYAELLNSIESVSAAPKKPLKALELLLGNGLPNHSIFEVKKEFITVFYAKSGEDFSADCSHRFPMQYADEIYFQIPADTARLRIDLSEVPSYYTNVSLRQYPDHQELEM
ncbi:glycosyltransferase family 4 protein, partial [Streptococcus sp. DD11]|uniref:glycosyltransferase family 4 protein n=1 Tax=Streptococcus sp. DD11 TaxID=1777879 RepID=UPI0010082EA8